MVHPINKPPIHLRESISKNLVKLKIYGEKEKLVATTYYSQVKVFSETPENKTIFRVVRNQKDKR